MLAGIAGLTFQGCRDQAEPTARTGSSPVAEPTSTPGLSALRVEIIHDTICPWCRIGCHNLHTAIDSLGPQPVEVVYRPYLLDPDTPPEGADLRERIGKKYGAERVSSMFDSVTKAGAKYGVHFDFDRVHVTPQTAPSHAVIAWAPTARQRALVTAIHLAYFERGENIGDPSVLGTIAGSVGLDAGAAQAAARESTRLADIRQQARAAQSTGISGVPHFVFGARTLHGAQAPEAIREAMLAGLAHPIRLPGSRSSWAECVTPPVTAVFGLSPRPHAGLRSSWIMSPWPAPRGTKDIVARMRLGALSFRVGR